MTIAGAAAAAVAIVHILYFAHANTNSSELKWNDRHRNM